MLALAGDDKLISINSWDGDLIKQCMVRDLPSLLQFADLKRDDELKRAENYVSVFRFWCFVVFPWYCLTLKAPRCELYATVC